MKYVVFIIYFLLSGCYLANGPPDSLNYWVKDGEKHHINTLNIVMIFQDQKWTIIIFIWKINFIIQLLIKEKMMSL
ncbi:hypothetical protein JL04_10835 [Gallibacterium anatis]|uniref:hypothetical protein n=1 Tax=Gallibacterium anatis TaxID=750 RepID=UPI000530F18D|nr:hypothetical protein [Gallibacterium anatis]KGQ47240.1 hypothetical protein JL04_10835 [Gallibacterium anatis]